MMMKTVASILLLPAVLCTALFLQIPADVNNPQAVLIRADPQSLGPATVLLHNGQSEELNSGGSYKVKVGDCRYYWFRVIKNGAFLDDIVKTDYAMLIHGHYKIEVYSRDGNHLVSTVELRLH